MSRLQNYLVCIAAITLLASAMCGATTYYVAVNGNDSYDGLAASYDGTHGPWATIDHGDKTSMLHPDDTVRVQAGTYDITGKVIDTRLGAGTADHPVTYVADGAVNIHSSTSNAYIWQFGSWISYVVVDGFNFSTARDAAIYINYALNIEVRNCHISGVTNQGIMCAEAPGALIHHNVIEGVPGSCLWVYDSSGIKLCNNTIIGRAGFGIFCFYGVSGEIKNNIMYSPAGWGNYYFKLPPAKNGGDP